MFQIFAVIGGMVVIAIGICGLIALVVEDRQYQKDWPQDRCDRQ